MKLRFPEGLHILYAENSGNFFVSSRISDTITVTKPIDSLTIRKILLTMNPELLHCESVQMQLAIDSLVADSFHNYKKNYPHLKGLRLPYVTDAKSTKANSVA